MTITAIKKDIATLEKALKSPAMADNLKKGFEDKLTKLKEQLAELEKPTPAKKTKVAKPALKSSPTIAKPSGNTSDNSKEFKRFKDEDIKAGLKFELPNGEIIEILNLLIEPQGVEKQWVEYRRKGKTEENSVKSLRIFLNNWKAVKVEDAKSEEPKTPEIKKTKDGKFALESITFLWAEGDQSKYPKFPAVYKTWESANLALYPMLDRDEQGYNKVKFEVRWADGKEDEEYGGRLDISKKEDNPFETNNVVGQHIYDFLYWLSHDPKSTETEENKKEIIEYLETYDLGPVVLKGKSTEKKEEPKAPEKPKPSMVVLPPVRTPKAKVVPITKNAKGELEYDCDELIAHEKEKKRKAKERAAMPKKTPATKNRDKIEAVLESVLKRLETEELTEAEIKKLLASCKRLVTALNTALKKIK